MIRSSIHDPVLTRFRAALATLFGDRLERVVLYGSRARGDFHPDSDYDVAVFLSEMISRTEAMDDLARVETDILRDSGALINALPFPAAAWHERTGFMHEVRRDGLDL
ncbi:MAG: nucleotidyltransferase domain-containing protein [Acetobacteraceae bacterium]|nr:nucleotidyltransferase domain-containing protein [Acetobacteraceae bacterium]